MTREEIMRVLPQRPPMLMVDDILELVRGEMVVGYKKIGVDEFWAQGHFPEKPVFPGVLVIEHMAQVSLFLTYDEEKAGSGTPFLAKVEQTKFLQPVLPGMELYTVVRILSAAAGFMKVEAAVYTDKMRTRAAAKGRLTCYLGQDVE